MYLDKDSVIVNGVSLGQYITNAKFGFYDTWSEDTGYTLSNKFMGTFKGTMPKISVSFRPLNDDEVRYLTAKIFRTVYQNVTYEDPVKGRITITTHKGDAVFEYSSLNIAKGFEFSLVGNEAL